MAEYTSLLPVRVNDIQICCMTLTHYDRIRLIGVDTQMIPAIRIAIKEGWSKPIIWELDYYGTYEFKLEGNPWHGEKEEAVMSRRLITSILKAMATYGWNLFCAADMTKTLYDKDTLFFENALPDPECQIFSISFNESDRIRVIDAPEMMPYVKDAVVQHWKGGIQAEREYFGSLELKLNGSPWQKSSCPSWFSNATETEGKSQLVVAQIIANLKAIGYKLYQSSDLSDNEDEDDAIDSLFFRKVGSTWQ